MKVILVLVASLALCTCSVLPRIPKDNSHYVEGVSRYIWMPDINGNLQLEDLHQTPEPQSVSNRAGENNQYWLYTSNNPTSKQIITNGNANSVQDSNYNPSRPLMVVVHGLNNDGDSEVNIIVRDAFLAASDCNVIVVDWTEARSNYAVAVAAVPQVGQAIGNFLNWLISTAGGNWNNVHLTGHSLGAHVVGNVGRSLGGRVARITGFDPAGPSFSNNANALAANDAQYVETINTSGGTLGINSPLGKVNFYPNGGRTQPGCGINIVCSHGRSFQFFAATLIFNHLIGNQCTDLSQANSNSCSGSTLQMGNNSFSKNGNGLYALTTGSAYPF